MTAGSPPVFYRTTINFDMRAPAFGPPIAQVYDVALEMIAYADAHGVEKVSFQEHHGTEDGYLPTPFLMGSAAGACTGRMAIVLGAVILPLHDPVKVAEQIAVCDLICGGRLHVVLAGGYVEREFAAFGVKLADRARLMDEGFDVILRALAGDRFAHQGRPVFVTPLPSRPARDIIIGGGGVPATMRRAARFGIGIWPLYDELVGVYEDECRRLGNAPGLILRIPKMLHITDDPDQGWAEIAPHLEHVLRSYAALSSSAESSASPWHDTDTIEKVRATGMIDVVTPQQAIDIGRTQAISISPLLGGLASDKGWRCLELFAGTVAPALSAPGRNLPPAKNIHPNSEARP